MGFYLGEAEVMTVSIEEVAGGGGGDWDGGNSRGEDVSGVRNGGT